MLSRAATTVAGSAAGPAVVLVPPAPPSKESGNGSSQEISGWSRVGSCATSARPPGLLRSDGSGRRRRLSRALRQALVAIRYSQVRSDARCSSKSAWARQARSMVSCTRSSASCREPSIR